MTVVISIFILIILGILIIYFSKNLLTMLPKYLLNYFIIFITVILVICIIIFPNQSVKAAYNGLNVWFSVVLPALLPFFIGSELLVGLGVIKFIGTLLEPIMRPLFNVPGEGAFIFAMSVTSGYPVGVKITSNLRKAYTISKVEAQRLVSFCSTSGPLFLIGAVSIGMFKSTDVGILLAICHYMSAIIIGIIFRFYKKSEVNKKLANNSIDKDNIIKKAFLNLVKTSKNAPSFGILLGNAVKESINTMLMIGGFIILFSVIINILELIGFVNLISNILFFFLKPFHIEEPATKALVTGLFEVTIGCKLAADTVSISLINRIAAAAFIIGWSGFSIHAQVISIINVTDINPHLYIFSKFLHGLVSYILIYMLYPVFALFFDFSTPAFNPYREWSTYENVFNIFKLSMEFFILILITLLFLSLFIGFCKYLSFFLNRKS